MGTEHKLHFELRQMVQGELAGRVKAQLWISMGFSGSSVDKESACNAGDPSSIPWIRKIPWKRDRLLIPVFGGFLGGSNGKESACNVGYLGLIPGLGRSPGKGKGYPLQYSCLENPHGQKSLAGNNHGISKSWTLLSD